MVFVPETVNLNQGTRTITTHNNSNRHCRVRFYAFVRQPLSKQLYLIRNF